MKTADFVIESFDPGYLDSLGLGYAAEVPSEGVEIDSGSEYPFCG